MRKLLISALVILSGIQLNAQKELLKAFKPVCDSLSKQAVQRFNVRSFIKLDKALVRESEMDLYFSQELSDFPWHAGDYEWMKDRIIKEWPRAASGYTLGGIYCQGVHIEDLIDPVLPSDGKPLPYQYADKGHARHSFVERVGQPDTRKGLGGRHIALWQSHGRYFDNGSGMWSWQRSPNWRVTEDLYTQSYVIPFLIPMLERAGAYVMTPRERDISSIEIICDNNPHFDSPGFPVRTHGGYEEEGRWKDAGSGFADRNEIYTGAEIEDPEDLKRFLRRDLLENPDHEQRGKHHARGKADHPVCRQRQHGGQIQDMPAQKHQNADEEDQLSLFGENPAEVQQYVRNAAEDEARDDELCHMRPGAAEDAQDHEAQGREALQHDRLHILSLALTIEEHGGKPQAQENEYDHFEHPFSCSFV